MKTLLFFILAAMLAAVPMATLAINLPSPPAIGGAGAGSDVWEYFRTAVVVIAGVVLVGIVVWYVVSGGGGLMSALKKARERGEWGEFFTYFVAMLTVGIVLFFLVYFANEEYLKVI